MGTITPVKPLQTQFDGTTSLMWTVNTDSTSFPAPKDIISHLTSSFTHSQLAAVKQVKGISELLSACPQNYNGATPCFAAIEFVNTPSANASDSVSGPMEYIIHVDAGLSRIDVVGHKSDFENRILPLQWAIDSVGARSVRPDYYTLTSIQAVIELQTGMKQKIPLEWPFTKQTNEEQQTDLRLGEQIRFVAIPRVLTKYRLFESSTRFRRIGLVNTGLISEGSSIDHLSTAS